VEKVETARVIVDTDLLIDLLREDEKTTTFISQLEKRKCRLATTAVNIFELYHGAHRSNQTEEALKSIRDLLKDLVLLSLTPRSAKKAGHIIATLEARGQLIGLRDTLVAAIAITRQYTVATRNVKHFSKIEGLSIISPYTT